MITMLDTQTMNLNYIRTFVVVGQSKSKKEAAAKLGVDLSNVSRHIGHLERIFNTKLIGGNDKDGIFLTKDGNFLFERYEKYYNDILLTEKSYIQNKSLNSGKITLGITPEIDKDILKKINSFKLRYPSVTVKIINLPTDELFDKLLQTGVDIVIDEIGNNVKKSNHIKSKYIYDEEYCIAYSDSVLRNELQNLQELNNKSLILPVRSKIERNIFDDLMKQEKVKVNLSFEFSFNTVGKYYVEKGMGFALLPKRELEGTKLKSFPLKIKKPIYLSYIEHNLSPTVKEFLKLFK